MMAYCFLFVLFLINIITANPWNEISLMSSSADWTHFVYMLADNNLDSFGISDLEEMRLNNATTEQLNLVVYIDRCLNCESDNYNLAVPHLYNCDTMKKISGLFSGSKILQKYGNKWCQIYNFPQELNSLKTDIISNFTALMSQYQLSSKYFMLEFWDHGGAWYGFGEDENKGSQQPQGNNTNSGGSLDDIFGAISKGLEETYLGRLDILGFDACIMADYSVLTYINHYDVTKYYIASEVSEPGQGWDYKGINASSTSLYQYAKYIIDSYVAQGSVSTITESGGAGYTLALFDMDKVSQFLSEYDSLIRMMTLALNNYDYGMIMAVLRAQSATLPAEAEFEIDDFGLLLQGLVNDNIYFDSCNDRLTEYALSAWVMMEESVIYFRADFVREAMTGATIFISVNHQDISEYYDSNSDTSSLNYLRFLYAMSNVLGHLKNNTESTVNNLTNTSCFAPISKQFFGTFNISNEIDIEYSMDKALYKISAETTPTIMSATTNIYIQSGNTTFSLVELQTNIIDTDFRNTLLTSYWDGNILYFVDDQNTSKSMFSTGAITYATSSNIPNGYTVKYTVNISDSIEDYINGTINTGYIQCNVFILNSSNVEITSIQLYEIDESGGISQISEEENKIIEGILTVFVNDEVDEMPWPDVLIWPNFTVYFYSFNSSIITISGQDVFGNQDYSGVTMSNINISNWDIPTTTGSNIMTTSTSANNLDTTTTTTSSSGSDTGKESESGLDSISGLVWLIIVIVLVLIIIVFMLLLCRLRRSNNDLGSNYAQMTDEKL